MMAIRISLGQAEDHGPRKRESSERCGSRHWLVSVAKLEDCKNTPSLSASRQKLANDPRSSTGITEFVNRATSYLVNLRRTTPLAVLLLATSLTLSQRLQDQSQQWTQTTFLDFAEGTLGDGGANTYLAADGSIRLINQWDLNGDRFLDLVFPSSHDNNYGVDSYIYWGKASFAETARTRLPGNGANAQAIADLNGDGFMDIVIANEFNGTKTELFSFVYWGSAGGFEIQKRTELPTVGATRVAAADLNRDGYLELIFASSGRSYQFSKAGGDFMFLRPVSDIYWGSANGFSPDRVTQLPTFHARDVKTADLNRDGFVDLLFANQGDEPANSGVLIYWGSEKGDFSAERKRFLSGIGTSAVAAADLDADGYLDVLLANERKPTPDPEFAGSDDFPLPSYIYWGSSQGYDAARRSDLANSGARDVQVGDLNGDGSLDVVFANRVGQSSFVYWGNRTRDFKLRRTALPTQHASRCATADLNGDGLPEIVFSQEHNGKTNEFSSVVYWNGANGFSAALKMNLSTLGALDVGIADLDRDGRPDLLFVNGRDGTAGQPVDNFIYWGNARGEYLPTARQVLPGDALTAYSSADLNRDGWVDLIVVGRELRVFWGSAAGFSMARSQTLPVAYAFSTRIADFDRDGFLDISASDWAGAPARDRTVIFWGSAGGYSADHRFTFAFPGARAHAVGDLDGNGYLDLIFSGTLNETAIFWNGPSGFSVSRKTVLPCKLAVSAEVADLNRDGFLDVIICNLYDPDKLVHARELPPITASPQTETFRAGTWIYWGSPAGYSPENRLELPTIGSEDAVVADLNDDSYLDLVVTSYHAGATRNHPSYIFWGSARGIEANNVTELPTESASGALVADFDENGWKDLLFACHTEGTNHRTNSFLYWGSPRGFLKERRSLIPSEGTHWLSVADIGNVRDRSDEFEYLSPPFDAGAGARFTRLLWKATTPGKTRVRFQLRTAADRQGLSKSPWVGRMGEETFYDRPGLILRQKGPWIQYKAILSSPNGANSPVLDFVAIRYDRQP